MPDHDRALRSAFTAQADAFNSSPVMHAAEILDGIVELADPHPDERWLEAACGPGIVSRRLAPHVAAVHGLDLTEAMVELARAEAARADAGNATFAVGDATATGLDASGFDGAVTRFSLHHIPLPVRVLAELARVVSPGGRIVVADHLADDDRESFAWTAEVERLRDPSHWSSLTPGGLREIGERAGLTLEDERVVPLELDLDEWLTRGTSDPRAQMLVEALLRERPGGTERFAVAGRRLTIAIWLGAWRVP